MNTHSSSHRGHWFRREIISHAVWLYHGFSLSLRNVEELLAKRGITVTQESIRQWITPRTATRTIWLRCRIN